MIKTENNRFVLSTKNTTYAFRKLESGQLEHMYYGKRIDIISDGMAGNHEFPDGNSIMYAKEFPKLSMEGTRFEYSSYGKGDIREPFIELEFADGGRTCDFIYHSHETRGKSALNTLPSSYDENGKTESLIITLKDRNHEVYLDLIYSVFEDTDVIVRSATLRNKSEDEIKLNRLMSLLIDFEDPDYMVHTFRGGWAREMEHKKTLVSGAKVVNESMTGSSSSRANPFIMVSRQGTSEDYGESYGFNLIYSGNHYEAIEDTSYNLMRVVTGINPTGFNFFLAQGESFEAPEAVISYSDAGFNGLSQNFHGFIREHVVRGTWKKRPRPSLINSWEAAYFKFNESSLLKLAKKAADAGIELFVLDDGWFGKRNEDTCSLGDWIVNKDKLPNGLEGLIRKIKDLGMDFGIWVEPEMVNVDSDLYRSHPEYAIEIPGQEHSEGRSQRILDLTNPEVCDYVIDAMSEIFKHDGVSYVKWDMNRIFSDVYSKHLSIDRQGEVFHRYIMGFYHIMEVLTGRFPNILFEGCASGGNRFDLGILCYFPQIWASDDTDALYRVEAMTSYSYGYPMSVVSAHVSNVPNHQTLRVTPLDTRYNVASFGPFGYELNLSDLDSDSFDAVKEQVAIYKKWRDVYFFGNFYRGRSYGNVHEWTVVSPDKDKAVGLIMQALAKANYPNLTFHARGLCPDKKYHFYNIPHKVDIRTFGDLINTASPIHIKNDSTMQRILAKFYKMNGEKEDMTLTGGELMYGGVGLKQAFGGTGFNDNVRLFNDFSSRLYYMEETED